MTDLLLQTKHQPPPVRDGLVPRPALRERLEMIFPSSGHFVYKLTLVSAPAGYGKTTLMGSWLQSIEIPVAWLSLDEDDNDPARFLAYLIAALSQVEASIGASVEAMLKAPQPPPPEAVLTVLLNAISALPAPFAPRERRRSA